MKYLVNGTGIISYSFPEIREIPTSYNVYTQTSVALMNSMSKQSHKTLEDATLFTMANTWKQSKYPLIDEWIKKMWGVCVRIYTYTQKPIEINELEFKR